MVLDTSLLNTQDFKVRSKGKVEQSRERLVPFPKHKCSIWWKKSLWVPQLRLLTLVIYYSFVVTHFRSELLIIA